MTANHKASAASVNGLRTLELGPRCCGCGNSCKENLGPGVHSISLTDTRTREEQEILGMSQILLVMFPFAIELVLKSLWDCHHENGTYERGHACTSCLKRRPEQRTYVPQDWRKSRRGTSGWSSRRRTEPTIAALSTTSSRPTQEICRHRYYARKPPEFVQLDDLAVCFYCVVYPLAAREPSTFSNLLGRIMFRGRTKP